MLAECCSQGQAAAAQVLLDAGAHPAWPDSKRTHRTALHAAAVIASGRLRSDLLVDCLQKQI